MAEPALTYGQLDEVLRTHGFVARGVESKARIYKHEVTGASVILPDAPFADAVLPHHLIVVRTVLKEFDLPEPAALALDRKRVG
jgi:hypothetical protein